MKNLILFLAFFCLSNTVVAGDFNVRLLALKHSREYIADMDADLAISAVDSAARQGLSIKSIGNHFVNRDGKMRVTFFDFKYDLPSLKQFISEQMKTNATPGDTVIVFTIGHGFGSGDLDNLGQRADVMQAIAEAAEENDQRTLWWQLSCHASAHLPGVRTLNAKQQELLTVLSSSTANELSAAGVQGKIMEKVFLAMAANNKEINPDQDGSITAQELKDFLNENTRNNRGNLLTAKDMEIAVFGGGNLANQIPIVDHNDPQGQSSENYIPTPTH